MAVRGQEALAVETQAAVMQQVAWRAMGGAVVVAVAQVAAEEAGQAVARAAAPLAMQVAATKVTAIQVAAMVLVMLVGGMALEKVMVPAYVQAGWATRLVTVEGQQDRGRLRELATAPEPLVKEVQRASQCPGAVARAATETVTSARWAPWKESPVVLSMATSQTAAVVDI